MATIFFFLWTSGSILLTVNVFTPLSSRSNSSAKIILLSFILGWIVGDLLPHWILFNLGILTIFSFFDILVSPIGIFGIFIHFSCWIILSIRLWIILDFPERINLKMEEIFGINWQKSYSKFSSPKKFFDFDLHSWFNPLKSLDDPRIEILRNQVFHEGSGFKLKLDIYKPKNLKNKRPGILQIHGGAWITGSKRQASFFLVRMALRGWICYSVTHRFSPNIIFPEHLIDIKRALKWIREHADVHGLDKNFIISKGGSSGGHLATLMALTQNRLEFQPDFKKIDTSIHGCISMYGVFNFIDAFNKNTKYPAKSKVLKIVCGGDPISKESCYKKITPSNWITENSPPFLIVQGESDALISLKETKKFWKDLKSKKKSSSVFINLPLIEHGFDVFPTLTAQCIVPVIEQFLIMLYKNYVNHRE